MLVAPAPAVAVVSVWAAVTVLAADAPVHLLREAPGGHATGVCVATVGEVGTTISRCSKMKKKNNLCFANN